MLAVGMQLAPLLANKLKWSRDGSGKRTFEFYEGPTLGSDQRIDLASATPTALSRALDRFAHVKHWHVDARSRSRLADDFTHLVAGHDRTDADRDDSTD